MDVEVSAAPGRPLEYGEMFPRDRGLVGSALCIWCGGQATDMVLWLSWLLLLVLRVLVL